MTSTRPPLLRRFARPLLYLLAFNMVAVGVMHFVSPEPFMRIVPPAFGDARTLVYVSGVFEILGGLGLLIPATRRAAAWGLIALFVAVFPANLYMATQGIQLFPENPAPEWAAWVRLPFQFLFIAWAYLFTRPDALASTASSAPADEEAQAENART